MLTPLILLVSISKTGAVGPAADIAIDCGKRSPISPYIYGVNYPDTWISDWLRDWSQFHTGFALAREGGNRFTAYNWETNASNAGADYYNENDDYLGTSNEPGWTVKRFLETVQATGTAALLTVPTLGYVAADKGPNTQDVKDVKLTPDYLNKRFLKSYASKPGGKLVYPPDTTDKAVYQDEFVSWVEKVKSPKTPVWFSLDNEPDLWHTTHPRIELGEPSYARIISNQIEYAQAIKKVAPDTLVFGPANYGWSGFRGFQGAKDANNRDFVDTYLTAFQEASKKDHRRLLDAYDFHWYPEATGGGVRIIYAQAPDKPETVAARIQAPRSLWDPTYIEDSWIPRSIGNKPIALLRDFKARIAAHYPGTKLSITEYEFGGRTVISGALAQADALGVFGREGLFAACHWGLNLSEHAALAGFKAFTDFDRKGAHFGDLGLAVAGETPAEDSVYAALDSNDSHRLTLVIINKELTSKTFRLTPNGFKAVSGRAFIVRDGVYDQPDSQDVTLQAGVVNFVAPPLSISSLELRR
jgi:hypothetical protein